jgi:hypothetical protein
MSECISKAENTQPFYFMFAPFKDARKLCWYMYCLQRHITRFAAELLKITIELLTLWQSEKFGCCMTT